MKYITPAQFNRLISMSSDEQIRMNSMGMWKWQNIVYM